MSKQKVFRTVGMSLSLAIIAVLIWQFMPNASAQKSNTRTLSNMAPAAGAAALPEDDSLILLNAAQINVKSDEAQKDRPAIEGFSGRQMHLFRFRGPIQPDWYKMLVSSGAEIVDYIPSYTYLVYGDANSLSSLQASAKDGLGPIEWDGPYKDEYKVAPNAYISKDKSGNTKSLASQRFQVQLVKDDSSNADTLQLINSIQVSPVKGQQEILHYVNLVVGLDEEGLAKLAARPDVISISPYFEPVKLDERQDFVLVGNLTGNAPTPGDYLAYLAGKGFTQAQFDAGFSVDLSDSGIDNATPASPNEFVFRRTGDPSSTSRFIYSRLLGTPNGAGSTLQGCDGHGNLNASIISGYVPGGGIFAAAPHADASAFRYGLGVAPFVKIGSSVIFDPDTFTSPNYANLQSQAYNDGSRISSNSWGSNANTYTTDSQSYDALVRDAQPSGSTFPTAGNQEMVIVFAAGNNGSGSNTVGSPSTGKNVITVGAGEGVQAFGGADNCGVADSGADSANDIIFFSSRGPTSDGRKKPDIILPGTHISGTVAQATNVSPVSGTGAQLTCFDGSGVCGGVGINFFPAGQQWYTASSGTSHSTPAISGFAALIRQDFINRGLSAPSPAMTKALMMNSASYMTGTGANDTLPSNSQGMGRANMNSYFDIFSQARILRDETNADRFTATGQQRVITGNVVSGAKPFTVTLAWSDAPGSTTGNAFVNNLDLEVTVGGQTYLGNVYSGASSVTGGTADARNNVESVSIPAGVTGNFVIKVKATNIAGDGVPGNADALDQDFALVVANGNEAALPVVASGATTITAESCGIPNNAIDPAETVTINFALSNIGTANTTNLVATLQPTGGVTSPSGPQTYGALIANGAAVSKSFSFTAGTTCGQTLTATFHLQDGASDLGNVTFTFLTGALSAPVTATYSSGNLSSPLPDQGTVDIPIVINDTGVVDDVNVKVRLNHTFDGDVQATLISPTGTSVPLVANRGSGGQNFGSGNNDCSGSPTVFDDGAATAISSGTAPFVGSFKPESPLAAVNGGSITGTWTVHFADTAAQDSGTVGCVQLEIARRQFVCCGVAGTPTIAAGGDPALLSESFVPHNNVPDPGETLTVNFPLINTGTGNTTSLVATLQNSGGITPVTTSQNYGVVVAAGPAVFRPFTFVANGVCGGTITATFHLQDGVTDLGNVTFSAQLGTISTSSQTFTNAATITIPATGTGASTGAPATPYPSNITVSGAPTSISAVTVTLSTLTHTFPGDVDVLLVSPTGRKFIVVSDVLGSANAAGWTGQTYTFDDAATALVPSSGPAPPTGSYKPTNYSTGDLFPAPAPASPYLTPATAGTDTLTSAFTGVAGGNPNGTWSLYVVDDASGDIGTMAGWSLTLSTSTNVCSTTPGSVRSRADFDGDGKTDLSIFRPSDGNWYALNSGNNSVQIANWGAATDKLVPGDYDNDGKTDVAVYRPSTGQWFILRSSDSTVNIVGWGNPGDLPEAADYDGDGKTDVAVYRPSDGNWYTLRSSDGGVSINNWGNSTDLPVQADYDGDGKADVAVFRPSTGQWFILRSRDGVLIAGWGIAGDKPVEADYDGDNKDDIAVFRPSDGNWYILRSSDGSVSIVNWGSSTDVPVPGDYDGDGKDDQAVYRNGTWFVLRSTAGPLIANWGLAGDVPIPAKYIP